VKIYEMHNVILHSKVVVVDGVWAAIGSSNFDHRSVIFNDEVDVVLLGSEAAGEFEDMFQANQTAAQPVAVKAWKGRPIGARLEEMYSLAWEYLL
jgi:cardiolipin synthase